ACAALEEVGAEGFEEVPEDSMCTHIMGGPETARVTGHLGATEIDTECNKAGGCVLDRRYKMGAVLAARPRARPRPGGAARPFPHRMRRSAPSPLWQVLW